MHTRSRLSLHGLGLGIAFSFLCFFGSSAMANVTLARSIQKPSSERIRWWGAMLDIGLPDAVGVSAVVRPLKWTRFHFGITTNAVAPGIRGGVTFVPFQWVVSPSFTAEGGHVFEGDMNWWTRKFGTESKAFERVNYSYANGHLGLEIGKPNRFHIFIHGGISYVASTLHGFQQVLQEALGDPTISFSDPNVSGYFTSGKIGFALYL